MSWKTLNRNEPVVDAAAPPLLAEAVKDKIRSFYDRYETKRAALLPALHIVQNTLGHVSPQAMVDIAELLDLAPSEVFDTVGFYTQYWTKPKGEKVIVCCRSVSCSVMGSDAVLQAFKDELGIGEHETTPDGKYSLMTEECLAGCDHAPCVLINEKTHKRVRPEDVPGLLKAADNAELDVPRSDLFDAPPSSEEADAPDAAKG